MAEKVKPRFTNAIGADFGSYAETMLQIAERAEAETLRHNAAVEKLLSEIRNRCGPLAWGVTTNVNPFNSTSTLPSGTNVTYMVGSE